MPIVPEGEYALTLTSNSEYDAAIPHRGNNAEFTCAYSFWRVLHHVYWIRSKRVLVSGGEPTTHMVR